MKKRVVFENGSDVILFFNEVLKTSGFRFWKELRTHTNIPKSRLEYYRKGTYSIPLDRYQSLNRILPKKKQNYFNEAIKFIDENWGAKKGGIITSQKHKDIFAKGRMLAWKNNTTYFDVKLPLDENVCEFIGAFIGDGFTNKYGSSYLIQFTGDFKLDYKYYKEFIIPTARSYFGIKPYIQKVDNTLRVNFYSKTLYNFLTQRLRFPAGKKSYTVKIPQEIFNSNQEHILTAILRGIYDTDGSIFFDKRCSQPYPRVYIKLINKTLIKQIYDLLCSFNLNPTITRNGYVIQINGKKYTKKFLREIGFSNPRHISRIKKNHLELLE